MAVCNTLSNQHLPQVTHSPRARLFAQTIGAVGGLIAFARRCVADAWAFVQMMFDDQPQWEDTE
jgi:hypothetical protein